MSQCIVLALLWLEHQARRLRLLIAEAPRHPDPPNPAQMRDYFDRRDVRARW